METPVSKTVSKTWHLWGNRLFMAAVVIFAAAFLLSLNSVDAGAPGWFVAFSYAMAPVGAGLGAHMMGFVTKHIGK
jgi:hypothetical protein